MFKIGDIIIYAEHGLSRIDNICDKTISNVTRTYYVLQPLEQSSLTISTPIDNDRVVMLKIMEVEEAAVILGSFKQQGISWIEDARKRFNNYQDIVKTGNRKEIARIVNTLMRKEMELTSIDKKLYVQDRKILNEAENILFKELAMSLNSSYEEISGQVNNMIGLKS